MVRDDVIKLECWWGYARSVGTLARLGTTLVVYIWSRISMVNPHILTPYNDHWIQNHFLAAFRYLLNLVACHLFL